MINTQLKDGSEFSSEKSQKLQLSKTVVLEESKEQINMVGQISKKL